jgi:hypothetical protein
MTIMKNFFIAAVMAVCSSVALGNQLPSEWTSKGTEGGVAYVVIPESAGITKSGKEWHAIVNYYENGVYVNRSRIHVTGCPIWRGQILMVSLADGEHISDSLDWARGGDRVFDGVAMNVCKAAFVKDLFKLPSRDSTPAAPARPAQPRKDVI